MDFIELYKKISSELSESILAYTASCTGIERFLFQQIGYKIDYLLEQDKKALIEVGIEIKRRLRKKKNWIDLVMFEGDHIQTVIEGKVEYTAHYVNDDLSKKYWTDDMKKDFKKLEEIRFEVQKYFVIFLISYNKERVPSYFKEAEKHNKKMEAKKVAKNPTELKEKSINVWKKFLRYQNLNFEEIPAVHLGICKNIPVEMDTLIVKM